MLRTTMHTGTRTVAAVGLLTLVPVAYYLQGTGRAVVWLSLLSVLLVVASLALMLGPAERSHAPE